MGGVAKGDPRLMTDPALRKWHDGIALGGERQPAFEWLAKAEQEESRGLLSMGVEPAFDSIRSEPRFLDLLRRLGLPNLAVPPAS